MFDNVFLKVTIHDPPPPPGGRVKVGFVPAAAVGSSPPPSVEPFLSPAPPAGHTPAAASCRSPSTPSAKARVPLSGPSVTSESGHTDAKKTHNEVLRSTHRQHKYFILVNPCIYIFLCRGFFFFCGCGFIVALTRSQHWRLCCYWQLGVNVKADSHWSTASNNIRWNLIFFLTCFSTLPLSSEGELLSVSNPSMKHRDGPAVGWVPGVLTEPITVRDLTSDLKDRSRSHICGGSQSC